MTCCNSHILLKKQKKGVGRLVNEKTDGKCSRLELCNIDDGFIRLDISAMQPRCKDDHRSFRFDSSFFQNVPKSCDDLKSNVSLSLSVSCCHAAVSFTDDEKEQLRKFTNRSYLLDKTSRHHVWLSLVDVLLAYCYEVRSTEGEHTVSERASMCVCVCL